MPWFAPLLAAFGFGALGPVAGGLAAGFQATFGTILGFSIFQSAAMGGFGVAIVNAMVIVLVMVVGFAVATVALNAYAM